MEFLNVFFNDHFISSSIIIQHHKQNKMKICFHLPLFSFKNHKASGDFFFSVLLVRCFYSLLLLVPRIKMWSFYKWLCQFYLEIESFKLTPSQATPNVIELHPHMYTFRGIFLHKEEKVAAENCFLKHKMISLATGVTYVMTTISKKKGIWVFHFAFVKSFFRRDK